MDVKKIIEKEKLENILNPTKANREFKITLRFARFSSDKFNKARQMARENPYYMEEGEGDYKRFYASFLPKDVKDLMKLFDLINNRSTTSVFINNKQIPYTQDLWLFLMWFYNID